MLMARSPGRGPNGRGTVYESPERSGIWWAQLPADDYGKRPKRRASSEQEAVKKLKELERERSQGLNLSEKDPTTGQFLDNWLEVSVRPNVRPMTYEDRVYFVGHYITPYIGAIRLRKLTTAHIQRMLNDMIERGLARNTARRARGRLITALSVAIQWKLLPADGNVAKQTKIALVDVDEDGKMKRLTAEQAQQLLRMVVQHRLYALYFLALTYGLRQGELAGLRWTDVDLNHREIHIRSQIKRRRREAVRSAPKTPKSRRTILIDDETASVLRAHAREQQEERRHQLQCGKWTEHGLVFPSEVGTPFYASGLSYQFKRVLKWARLPDIRFHDMRHTAASLMLENGVPLADVSEILGHANPAITARLYLHGSNAGKRQAAETMSALLRRAP
jgi:integrase